MTRVESGDRAWTAAIGGLILLLKLNSDRILYVATVAFALALGTFAGTLILP